MPSGVPSTAQSPALAYFVDRTNVGLFVRTAPQYLFTSQQFFGLHEVHTLDEQRSQRPAVAAGNAARLNAQHVARFAALFAGNIRTFGTYNQIGTERGDG